MLWCQWKWSKIFVENLESHSIFVSHEFLNHQILSKILNCGTREEKKKKKTNRKQIKSMVMRAWASLIAQLVKNPPAMQETLVWFLDQEDPLEKGKATQ